jgi:hypothetical protein
MIRRPAARYFCFCGASQRTGKPRFPLMGLPAKAESSEFYDDHPQQLAIDLGR